MLWILESLTLIVLAWTLWEIARTRKIAAQQKDLQLLPAMMLYIRHDENEEQCLRLRNIGFGTAVMVEIVTSRFKVADKEYEFRFKLRHSNSTLIANEERDIEVSFYKNGIYDHARQRHLIEFISYFDPEKLRIINAAGKAGGINDMKTPSHRELTVRFKDITGQQYNTVLLFSEDGISILQTPERTGKISWAFKIRSKLANILKP